MRDAVQRRGPRLGYLGRYAWADLRFRKAMTGLSVAAVAVAVVFLEGLGFYAWAMYTFQARLVGNAQVNGFTLGVKDTTEDARRFTAPRLEDLRRTPGVEAVVPRVGLRVLLSLDGRGKVEAQAESTVPDDPAVPAGALAWGRRVQSPAAPEILLPEATFAKLGGKLTPQGPRPEQATLEVARTVDGATQTHTVPLRITGLVRRQATTLAYVPLAVVENLDRWCLNLDDPHGPSGSGPTFAAAFAYGPKERGARSSQEAGQFRLQARPVGEVTVVEAERDLWLTVRPPDGSWTADGVARALGKARVERLLPVHVRPLVAEDRQVRLVACADDDPRWAEAPGKRPPELGFLLTTRPVGRPRLTLHDQPLTVAGHAPRMSKDNAYFCSLDTFLHLEAAAGGVPPGKATPGPAEEYAARVAVIHHAGVCAAAAGAGLVVEPITPVREEVWTRYALTPQGKDGGRLTPDLLAAVAQARPTFTAAAPVLTVKAFAGGKPVTLEASDGGDPRRFASGLTAGCWLNAQAADPEVILPLALARDLAGQEPPETLLARAVRLEFVRERRVVNAEPALNVPFRVVGLADVPHGYAPLPLLIQVAAWSEGKVHYNETKKSFVSPAELVTQSGHLRCSVYARDAAAAARLVPRFEGQGYLVEHRLHEQEGLDKLGRVLASLVALFGGGFALSAFITVLITTAMSIESKTSEIGILLAHGVAARWVTGLFGLQGLLLGAAAFVAGSVTALLVEPLTTRVICDTFRVPPGAIPSSLAAAGNLPIFLAALLLAVLSAVLGAVAAARLKTYHLSPVQALQRQD